MGQEIKQRGSIHAVARAAGVSIVTVSRVFNDYPHVSARMRERVLEAARRCGYAPRVVAKPRVLAALVGHLDHLAAGDYKTRLMLSLVQESAQRGYLVDFIPFDAAELATKGLVDGIVEIGLTPRDLSCLRALPAVPTVVLNNAATEDAWYAVACDHCHEVKLATRYLLDRGHRRIALVLDELEGWGVEHRARGFTAAMRAAGCADSAWILSAEERSPDALTREVCGHRCSACLVFTDNHGLAVLDSFVVDRQLSIPRDLSVVCLENGAVSPFYHPRLTTIAQPLERMAASAVETVIRVIEQQAVPRKRMFRSRLVERDSVLSR